MTDWAGRPKQGDDHLRAGGRAAAATSATGRNCLDGHYRQSVGGWAGGGEGRVEPAGRTPHSRAKTLGPRGHGGRAMMVAAALGVAQQEGEGRSGVARPVSREAPE